MKFYHSIRFRIVVGFLLFGALLIILNSAITMTVASRGIGRMITNLMASEVASFLTKYETNKNTPLPNSRFIRIYKGIENVPEKRREQVRQLPPGIYDLRGLDGSKHKPFHLAVIEVPDSDTRYYMAFLGRQFFRENSALGPKDILLISLAMLFIPGIILGVLFSRTFFAPVKRLMDQIQELQPENIPAQFTHDSAANEIGQLSRTLQNTMGRIKSFIQREKQFTRDASHELRTPLTIIKGAVEIMGQQPETKTNPMLGKPLARIDQSIKDMEGLVETFLWLAREGEVTDESTPVEPMVRKAIKDNRHLIRDKDICVTVKATAPKTVQVKEEILYVAISNLVRNAFQYTSRGEVTLEITNEFLEVSDTGSGIESTQLHTVTQTHVKGENSHGFGLGLSIVQRFCTRFGWELNIESRTGRGTRVRLLWDETRTKEKGRG